MKEPYWERKLREKFSFLNPSEQVSKDINRGVVVGLAIVFISIGLYAAIQTISQSTTASYKCPEDYKTEKEHLSDARRYIDEALAKNPNATEEEIFNKRLLLLSSLGCKGAEQYLSESYRKYLYFKSLTHVTDQYAGDLYLVSRQDFGNTCSTEDVDWNIAVRALSEYHYANESHDIGPAEIQRHFEENCEADLKIYADYTVPKATE